MYYYYYYYHHHHHHHRFLLIYRTEFYSFFDVWVLCVCICKFCTICNALCISADSV